MSRWDLWFYHFAALATSAEQTFNWIQGRHHDYTIPILFFAVANLTREIRKQEKP